MKSLILAAGSAVALLTTTLLGRFADLEPSEYSDIAANILSGNGPLYEFLGTPYYFYGSATYPWVLASVVALSGSEFAVLVLQAVLFGCTCVAAYLVAKAIGGETVAVVASALTVIHPGSLVYAGKIHSQTLDVLLITVSFWLLFRLSTLNRWTALGVGALAGIAAISRATILPFYLLWTCWFLWRERRQFQPALMSVAAFGVGGLLVVSPILIAGYARYGGIVPLRSDSGTNLWVGNHPSATGTSFANSMPPEPALNLLPQALRDGLRGLNEMEQNRAFSDASWRFIQNQPEAFAGLLLKKIYYFWWFSPHTGLQYPGSWTGVYALYYSVVLSLAAVGLSVCFYSGSAGAVRGASMFLMLAASYSITQAVFYVDGRHRWQLAPLMLGFTAIGLVSLVRFFLARIHVRHLR